MKVSMIGCGKLGLPVAVAMDMLGHDVVGYDVNHDRMSKLPQPYKEAGPRGDGDFNDWLQKSTVRFGSLDYAVEHGEIIFVAVQTPHEPEYEGVTSLPKTRVDFDYSFLIDAMRQIVAGATPPKIVAIISTVMPGTIAREIMPLLEGTKISLVYNPSFIAMGTTMRDFLDPEFILVGGVGGAAQDAVERFYKSITNAPIVTMSVPSAELTKVAYNTFISLKIAFANTVMEVCDHVPMADCDEVWRGLSMARRRILSPAYMRGGMGDGGGCHPRDNIALSWFARVHGLSFDLFDAAMRCREAQAKWLADMMYFYANTRGQQVVILGAAFKPETNLIVGSPALLTAALLEEHYSMRATVIDDNTRVLGTDPMEKDVLASPAVILIGCRHERYKETKFAEGSIVIDPHRYIPDQDGVAVMRLGEASRGLLCSR